jgi:Abortive infection alpha
MSAGDSRDPVPPAQSGPSLVPGVVRLAATAWWHTTEWTVGVSVKAGKRALGVAVAPDTAGALVRDIRDAARDAARDLVGLTDIEDRLRSAAPSSETARKVAETVPGASAALRVVESVQRAPSPARGLAGDDRRNGSEPSLQIRGEELLHRSRDVRYEEDAHPAYERLLDSLAPDEARILRLMLLDGPQPAVDVRTGGPLGLISSRLLAPGLSMIGPRAGLRYVERVPAYLNNLNRLGLIWFSRETLRDPLRYQVLEAQPDVLEAVHSVRQAKIIRRSIHLTPFGEGFCRASLVPAAERLPVLPAHGSPERPRQPQPPSALAALPTEVLGTEEALGTDDALGTDGLSAG